MPSRRSLSLLSLTAVALAASAFVYLYSTKHSRAISHHRQHYLALEQQYSANNYAIIKDEPRRFALVQAKFQEHRALIELGYLVETNLPLKRKFLKELQLALDGTSFVDRHLSTYSILRGTNDSNQTLNVIACQSDIPTWKRIVAEFNAKSDN